MHQMRFDKLYSMQQTPSEMKQLFRQYVTFSGFSVSTALRNNDPPSRILRIFLQRKRFLIRLVEFYR
eukprot:m.33891 g.33891  ORF g.33891 m.33891 type:complete len:67 (-) comp43333_c0_seq2:749-949(-)